MKKTYTHLLLAHKTTWFYLPLQDIIYFKTDTNCTTFYALGRAPIEVTRNGKLYENLLLPLHFAQINRGTVINLQHVQQLNKLPQDYEILLAQNITLAVVRTRRQAVLRKLQLTSIAHADSMQEPYTDGYAVLLH